MKFQIPDYLDPSEWIPYAKSATREQVRNAIYAENPGPRELAFLLSETAAEFIEEMAQRAQKITRRHFGRTIQMYVPLYLSSYCSGGCAYCGFASDRRAVRHALTFEEMESEMLALKALGFEEILMLTGERTNRADFEYVKKAVVLAAKHFHNVTVEVFPMEADEYKGLVEAGCTGVTMYQETFHPEQYERMHRWGPKSDYNGRIDAPDRMLSGGIRTIGLGVLLGLSDPIYDLLTLFIQVKHLQKKYWKSGIGISFPRLRPELGGFAAEFPVDEKKLAQFIFAFRIVLPDAAMSLSTRESAAFRNGMMGLGPTKMSANSKTTVGGYSDDVEYSEGQFDVNDERTAEQMCADLRTRGFEPVFKNWDMMYRS